MTPAQLSQEAYSLVRTLQNLRSQYQQARERLRDEYQDAKTKMEAEYRKAVEKAQEALTQALGTLEQKAQAATEKANREYTHARAELIAQVVSDYFPSTSFANLFFPHLLVRARKDLHFRLESEEITQTRSSGFVGDVMTISSPSRVRGTFHLLLEVIDIDFLKVAGGIWLAICILLGVVPAQWGIVPLAIFFLLFLGIPFFLVMAACIIRERWKDREVKNRLPYLWKLHKQCEENVQKITDRMNKEKTKLQKDHSERMSYLEKQYTQRVTQLESKYLQKLQETEERFLHLMEAQKRKSEYLISQGKHYCPLWEDTVWEQWQPGTLLPGLVRLGQFVFPVEGS